jgi:hypothetical protein
VDGVFDLKNEKRRKEKRGEKEGEKAWHRHIPRM